MARTKAEYTAPETFTVPTEIPEGCETMTAVRYLERAKRDKNKKVISGTDRPITLKVIGPVVGEMSGSGIVNMQKIWNDAGKNGNELVAEALRTALIDSAFALCKAADTAKMEDETSENPTGNITVPDSLNLLPVFPGARLVDEHEATAQKVKSALSSGKKYTMAELEEMFGSIIQK